MNITHNWFVSCATLGPIGYFYASGTCATIFTLPWVIWLQHYGSLKIYCLAVGLIIMVSSYCIRYTLPLFSCADPACIVLDEVVGCFITFINIPNNFFAIIVGFLLFRFFDITKCCGIDYIQRLPGAAGILADDILAGILANMVLFIGMYFF